MARPVDSGRAYEPFCCHSQVVGPAALVMATNSTVHPTWRGRLIDSSDVSNALRFERLMESADVWAAPRLSEVLTTRP